jgi:putative tryptophan/tyrosine transport system substrate-binding protein
MKRAAVPVILIAVMLLAVAVIAEAQQPKKNARIGFLSVGSASSVYPEGIKAFRQGLRDLGYVEGQNLFIDWRFAEGKREVLPALASDLVRLKVDVIVTQGTSGTNPAKRATDTIPIVMAYSADPVGTGLVASLAHPGGNVTGLSEMSPDLAGKRVELVREVVPKATRIAVLWDRTRPANIAVLEEIETAARQFSIQVQSLAARDAKDIDRAFRAATQERAGALLVPSGSVITQHGAEIMRLAIRSRLPSIWDDKDFVDLGGLMSYGPNLTDLHRRAAIYVDRILKGAKPADLPVEQPTKFELVINQKTAKQIGVNIPQSLLYRADRVIK